MIEKIQITKKDRINMLIAYIVIAGLMAIAGGLIWTSRTVDEMGTLSNAAYLAGYNWVNGTHSAGDFYYKYGTALLYTAPFLGITDPILQYRVLLIINGLALGFAPVSAYWIARKHLKIQSELTALIFALISAGTPAALLHSNYCRGDFLMVLMPWVAAVCLFEAKAACGKRKILFSILLSISAVYAYMSHTRGIVLVIAVTLTVFVCYFLFKIRLVHIPAYVFSTVIMLIIDKCFTAFFKSKIWVYGAGHAAMESIDIDRFEKMFSMEGIKVLIKTIIGWCYTIFTSTLGLVCVGVIAAVIVLILSLGKAKAERKIREEETVFAFLGSMIFLGNMGSGILFFYPYVYANFLEGVTGRGDRVFYERYMAGALGLLCLLGLYVVFFRKDLFGIKAKIVSYISCVAAFFVFVFYIAVMVPIWNLDRKMTITLYSFLPLVDDARMAFIVMGFFSLFIFAVWLFLAEKRKMIMSTGLILSVFLFLFLSNYYVVRYKDNRSYHNRAEQVYDVLDEIREVADEFPYVYVGKDALKAKVYQPILKEFQVGNSKMMDEYLEISDLFIICKYNRIAPSFWNDQIYTFDELDYENGNANRIYVKGERLYQRLSELGVKLTKMEQ